MDLKSTYNKIAADWVKDHNADTWWVEGTDKFLSLLPLSGTVLDVGCGAGVKSKYLLDKGYEVTGIDFSEKMIELAKAQVPGVKFLVKDIQQSLNFENQFNGVFAQAVLLHIPKKEIPAVLQNLTAVLKPGGPLYIAVKQVRSNGIEEEIVKESDYGYEYERFFSYFTPAEIKEYLTELGFKIEYENISTASNGGGWIQIIAQKPA